MAANALGRITAAIATIRPSGRRRRVKRLSGQAARAIADGDLEAAIEAYGEAIRLDGTDPAIYRSLARAARASGDHAVIDTLLSRLQRLEPSSLSVREFAAGFFLNSGRIEKAEAEARQALKFAAHLPPSSEGPARRSRLTGHLAQALARQGRLEDACRHLDECLAGNPDEPIALEARIQLADNIGDLPVTRKYARTLHELQPDHLPTANKLTRLELEFSNGQAVPGLIGRFDHTHTKTEDQFLRLLVFHLRRGEVSRVEAMVRAAIDDGCAGTKLEMVLLSCEFRQGNLVSAVNRLKHFDEAPDLGAARLFLYSQFRRALQRFPDFQTEFGEYAAQIDANGREILDATPNTEAQQHIDMVRARLRSIRDGVDVAQLKASQSLSASIVCPIHRPRDVANAVRQMGQQTWRNTQAVFGINSATISERDIRELWTSDIPLTIVDCVDVPTVGGVLNRAIEVASGDIVLKIDADNLYLPDYVQDTILAMQHLGAEVANYGGKFRLLEASNVLLMPKKDPYFKPAPWGSAAGGSAICFRRDIFHELRFQEYTKISEDQVFFKSAAAQGFAVFDFGPFNHVSVRSADPSQHSWAMDDLEFVLGGHAHLVGGAEAIDRLVGG